MKRVRLLFLALSGLVFLCIGGCGNTLYFMERTKTALAVELSGTSPEPVELTVGYKRTIATLVPPKHSDVKEKETENKGEALSMLSRFQLVYDDDNKVNVENLFVTGRAARSIGSSVEATNSLVGSTTFSNDVTQELVSCWLRADEDGSKRASFSQWVDTKVSGVSPTRVRYGTDFEETRKLAIKDLQISCNEG